MRCLTLADELSRQGHQSLFITRDHSGHLGELIASKGFELYSLAASDDAELSSAGGTTSPYAAWLGVPWEHDAKQTFDVLSQLAADWLVVDHYALDARWEQSMAKVVGRIMVIDDLADRNHECALLLDQNLGRQVSDYDQRVPVESIRMIGPHYALLRPEFYRLREISLQRRRHPELKRILISLGGVDRANATGRILNALSETLLPRETELDIVIGAAAPHLEKVRQQALRSPFRASVNVNVHDMAERMRQADLSIGAAGSTSWERCCLGLPSITIILAENQRLIGEALEKAGCALLLGEENIAQHLSALVSRLMNSGVKLEKLGSAAGNVCDGHGCARLVAEMTRKSH
jgi:UDP-2,4-diacetamido-2,4,6-trideoxy-beta-L-altropyranose hydrolase